MPSFKEKVTSFLKAKNLESEFIMFLSECDDNDEQKDYRNKDTAKYMGERHSLKRLLNTVGKKTFVEYYGNYNSQEYLDDITRDGEVKMGSALAKRSSANKIFELDLQEDALMAIANSNRVESWVSRRAKKLLKENF